VRKGGSKIKEDQEGKMKRPLTLFVVLPVAFICFSCKISQNTTSMTFVVVPVTFISISVLGEGSCSMELWE
jgi:hypothetical protein